MKTASTSKRIKTEIMGIPVVLRMVGNSAKLVRVDGRKLHA